MEDNDSGGVEDGVGQWRSPVLGQGAEGDHVCVQPGAAVLVQQHEPGHGEIFVTL